MQKEFVICMDKAADIGKVEIAVDAKTQYPAACNAIETLLVHQSIASAFLPLVAAALQECNVELRGMSEAAIFLRIPAATEIDWATEYSDLILSIKIVDSLWRSPTSTAMVPDIPTRSLRKTQLPPHSSRR